MAKLLEIINSLGVGEDGVTTAYPETFIADITGAYEEDMSFPTAKIGVLEAENAALAQENMLLKAHNYELLTLMPSSDDAVEELVEEPGEDTEETIDSLFTEKEDD